MANQPSPSRPLPILIIGAGISGLLLAQQLRQLHIPFQIYERDADISTRGLGWGITLHWSLPALRELLPEELLAHLPETYVNRAAVERGESSCFPFYDLSTGELKSAAPKASKDQRIRVTRERLRRLLATGIDVQWGKAFESFREEENSVTATFDNGLTVQARMIVGCDGIQSRVRHALFPQEYENYQIGVRMLGFTMRVSTEQAQRIRKIDPFFLQGTASATNMFTYISLLEAPESSQKGEGYLYQVCISWNTNKTMFDSDDTPSAIWTNEQRINLIRKIVSGWAEPFRSFLSLIPDTTEVKKLDIGDFAPHSGLQMNGRVLLIGDAFHAMAMYRGEGANHAIVDVLGLKEKVLLQAVDSNCDSSIWKHDLRGFGDDLVARTRPAVLTSRKACLDAHDWQALTPESPLLSRRQMIVDFQG